MKSEIKNEIVDLLSRCTRPGVEKILPYLESTDYFTAPASTRYHGAFEGGLALHSLNVAKRLMEENLTHETAILVGLLHDLCKTNFYKPAKINSKNPDTGKWETIDGYAVDDVFPMGHGEKSVFLIQEAGLPLTREELMAIRWHMGVFSVSRPEEITSVWMKENTPPLVLLTHVADGIAARVDDECMELVPLSETHTDAFYNDLHEKMGAEAAVEMLGNEHQTFVWLWNRYVKRAGNEKLLAYLEKSNFFKTAASRTYMAENGGNLKHTMKLFYNLLRETDAMQIDVSMEELVTTALCANIGNIDTYAPEIKHRKNDNGAWEDYVVWQTNETIPYGSVYAKSVFMTQPFMRLTRRESQAIRWIQGPLDGDKSYPCPSNAAYDKDLFAYAAHLAWLKASYLK